MDAETMDTVGQAAQMIKTANNEFNIHGILLAIGDATGQPVNLIAAADRARHPVGVLDAHQVPRVRRRGRWVIVQG